MREDLAPGSLRRRLVGLVSFLNRHPVTVLSAISAIVAVFHLGTLPISWHFFRTAGDLVLNGTVLHVYSTHPQLQFGPIAFLAAVPLALLPPPVGAIAGSVVMLALGVIALWLIFATFPVRDVRSSMVWWVGAALAVIAWAELAVRYGHLDDALALVLLAVALLALRRDHPAMAALLLAFSVDSKPWAVPAVALLLLTERRLWAPLFVLCGAAVAACWLPFLIVGGHSMNAAQFAIPIEPASTLSLFPLHTGMTPRWCRPAQMVVGTALACLAVRYRSPAAAIVAMFAVRLGLDPSVKAYYDIELVLGTLLCDVTLFRGWLPWLTLAAMLVVFAPTYLLTDLPSLHAWVRTVGLVGVLLTALTGAHAGYHRRVPAACTL